MPIGQNKDDQIRKSAIEVYNLYKEFYHKHYNPNDVTLEAEMFVSVIYPDYLRRFPRLKDEAKDGLLAQMDYDIYQKYHLDDVTRKGLRIKAVFDVLIEQRLNDVIDHLMGPTSNQIPNEVSIETKNVEPEVSIETKKPSKKK